MNGTVSAKEIKSIINNCPKQKPPGPNEFTDNFYQKYDVIWAIIISEDRSRGTIS